MTQEVPRPRRATAADLDAIVETLTLAFADDPVWRPTLTLPGDPPDGMADFWAIWVKGALRYPHVWMHDDAAVSVWVPPGGTEVSDEQFEELRGLAQHRLGQSGTEALLEVFETFEHAHPQTEPHFYLSLLGTHPNWRGQGHGMRLLSSNLAHADKEGVPTYLESSNPANDRRYQRVGYRPVVSFELPGGQLVTGMWRPVGGQI
jgi:GNAT superfamily N-acetyltransferase